MADCELRQRKKEEDGVNRLQEDNKEIKLVGQDQVQTENKQEPINDCIQSCVTINTMPPMVRRYRPVHKIYNAYQNLRKLKGPKHWYAGSNYFRTNYYRRFKKEDFDSEDDKNIDLSAKIPSGTNKMPHILETLLSGISERWRNWIIRGIFGWLMIGLFCLLCYGGPLALMIAVLVVQVKCFEEIINIGYSVYRIHGLPWFRSLSWYFLMASNYFFYGESLVDIFAVVVNRTEYLKMLITYHRFVSFSLYIAGLVWFVLSLVRKYYMKQFSLFAWTHVCLLIVVSQSYFIIRNIFEGLIWFIVPVSMIILNDIWAYVFGFFFGRTPLIQVSPKKTWEGFIGGGVATVICGIVISYFLCQYPYFVCPVEYSEKFGKMIIDCDPSPLYTLHEYILPDFIARAISIFGISNKITLYPFMIHTFWMSLFSSIIGPFGGFFASGFKRAFKIKDFGDVIPGHGGIMDRFDCQYLMATFVNVYIYSFVSTPTLQKTVQQVFTLRPEEQLQLFYVLKGSLENRVIFMSLKQEHKMENAIIVKDLELLSLIGFDGNPLNGLILHPDGIHLVYPLGTNITAYNWSSKAQRFFEGHTNIISAVTISKSGKYVGSGQVNYMGFRAPIIIWDFNTGLIITKYESHKVRVESVAFSCCEHFLVSLGGLDDGSIIVYDIEKKEVLCGSSSVKSTAGYTTVLKPMHLRGKCFIVAGDNILRLWTLNKEQRNIQWLDTSFAKIKRKILCCEIDHLDEYAYCGTSTGDIMKIKLNFSYDISAVMPTNSPTMVGCFAKYPVIKKRRNSSSSVELYSKGITSLYLIADGTIIVGSGDGIVELVKQNVRSGDIKGKNKNSCKFETRLATPTHPLLVVIKSANVDSSVTSIQLMKNVILVGTVNCELFTIRMDDFDVTCLFTCHTSVVYDLAFPYNYSKVFATASKNDVRIWSVITLQELLRITVQNFTCSGVLFSFDGSQIVTSWNDGNIRIFTPETGRLLYAINNCHNKGVSAIAMSKDGKKLLSGGGEGQVRVWKIDNLNGTLQAVLKEHKGPVSSIDVHQLGHEAITASADGTCVVWDIVRFTRLSIMFSSTIFTSAKYHPNGVQLLTCGTNRYIGFWEALDGSMIREIEGSSASALNSLDVTPNGKYIVTGSSDQMVKVWLYDEGVPTHVGVGHAGVVTNVKVSPDGRSVISTSADGGIFLWRFPHAADIAPPSSGTNSLGGGSACSLREQQTNRSRLLSLKKTMPARKENINNISKTQKVRTAEDGVRVTATTCDGQINAAVDGSVKCLCRCGTTCTCCDRNSGDTRKSFTR